MDLNNSREPKKAWFSYHHFGTTILVFILIVAAAVGMAWWQAPEALNGQQEEASSLQDSSGNVTEGWNTYTNERYGYKFRYPDHYKVNTRAKTNIAPFVSSDYVDILVSDYNSETIGQRFMLGKESAIKHSIGGNMDGGIEYSVSIPSKKITILFNGKNPESKTHTSEYDLILSTFSFSTQDFLY